MFYVNVLSISFVYALRVKVLFVCLSSLWPSVRIKFPDQYKDIERNLISLAFLPFWLSYGPFLNVSLRSYGPSNNFSFLCLFLLGVFAGVVLHAFHLIVTEYFIISRDFFVFGRSYGPSYNVSFPGFVSLCCFCVRLKFSWCLTRVQILTYTEQFHCVGFPWLLKEL